MVINDSIHNLFHVFRFAANEEILQKLNDKLTYMSRLFYNKFPNKEEAPNKFQLAKSLYYYLLDKILHFEFRIKPIDLKSLFQKDIFNTTLIACSVEIVLDAYSSDMEFPWILDCFNINAFEFYKLIEIIVRSHDGILNRELIKHLNLIEETCLESLAWQKSSPVWNLIKTEPSPLPTWSEVKVGNTDHNELQCELKLLFFFFILVNLLLMVYIFSSIPNDISI